jgi:uncharacterized protein YbcC (UPF0753/DUF2309 family)
MTATHNTDSPQIDRELEAAVDRATRAIPPVWPLSSSVAVNPFLGQTSEPLADTAARLSRVSGIRVTMPREWYLERIASGQITHDDLAEAMTTVPAEHRPESVAALQAAARSPAPTPKALPTVAELAAEASGTDWPGLLADRFGAFAASYFDAGQALWAAPNRRGAYTEWRAVATHDLTPEIMGLKHFAAHVANAPESAEEVIGRVTGRLGIRGAALQTYFHQLLMTLGGWAQYGRYQLWQAELGGDSDDVLTGFLAIRLLWEEALFMQYESALEQRWAAVRDAHLEPVAADAEHWIDAALQNAAERAAQRTLVERFVTAGQSPEAVRPALQAAFCIDVRSEVYRRSLEAVDPAIETLGFAGFFGIATSHRRFASDVEELRLPVLLNPGLHSRAGGPEHEASDTDTRFAARAVRAWKRFKLAAVSSFAFVEATGPLYLLKLVRDALGLGQTTSKPDPAPHLQPALDLEQRTSAAATVLNAMSLTDNFARIVLLAGHGANVINNPHASALHCGACGGYSGEVNARLLAGILNDPAVRTGLHKRGIRVPGDTLFVPALHDTTTDTITLYTSDVRSPAHDDDITRVREWLAAASRLTRDERAERLPRASTGKDIAERSRNWAEVRPEWALAGCQAFIAAPRQRTAGRDLEGRAFLHNYDWRKDDGFSVLELILTAPVVVASWISLQYYGSTVAPSVFGGGNKLLHNVTGGIGVVEGNGGLLRAGLPWQSVHDGERLVHEPLRLSVFLQAPIEAINDILRRHPDVRALFDNGWLHLFMLDDEEDATFRYDGDLAWTPVRSAAGSQGRLKAVV